MKALVVYKDHRRESSPTNMTELDFPLNIQKDDEGDYMLEKSFGLESRDVVSIDVVPEEEYFLKTFETNYKFCIPASKLNRWYQIHWLYTEDLNIHVFNEFGQYRVEGDWDKQYKITKR